MPFGGQICPAEPAFPELGSHGVSDAPFQGDEPGLSGRPFRWSDLGYLVFLGTPVPRGSFCSVSTARPRAGKKSVRFSCVLRPTRKKRMLLRPKKKTRVGRKSLRRPVACVYYDDLPPRGRAPRWTENHPRERGTCETRETSHHQATKRRMSTRLFLAISRMPMSGADKHLCGVWRTRPPGGHPALCLARARPTHRLHSRDMRATRAAEHCC